MAERYFNFNENKGLRSWSDAMRYGFVSCGDNAFSAAGVLDVGDTLWVFAAGHGYVGRGVVSRAACPAEDAVLDHDGVRVRFFDLELSTQYFRGDGGKQESVVAVKWERAVPLASAVWEPGFFSNQNIVCTPSAGRFKPATVAAWDFTVARLRELWKIE